MRYFGLDSSIHPSIRSCALSERAEFEVDIFLACFYHIFSQLESSLTWRMAHLW